MPLAVDDSPGRPSPHWHPSTNHLVRAREQSRPRSKKGDEACDDNRDRHDGGRVISIVSPGTNKPTFSSAMTARIAVYPYTCRRCSTYHAIAIIRGAAHRNEPEPATDPECLRSVRLESTLPNPFIIVEAR